MTLQVSDTVRFNQDKFNLAAYSESELFNPTHYGYLPTMMSTACRRGYVCQYDIHDGRLILDRLTISHYSSESTKSINSQPQNLNGTIASLSETRPDGLWVFDNINLLVEYSGGLIIAQGLQRLPNVKMAFHPAWKYTTVYELIFESGVLVSKINISQEMKVIRERIESEVRCNSQMPSSRVIDLWFNHNVSRGYSGWSTILNAS